MEQRTRRTLVALALLAVYFVWGSTYLALRFGLEGFPPFVLNSLRFMTAGVVMYAVLRLRGVPAPTARQWRHATAVGVLLLVGGVGLVTIAEDLGVGSGVAATAVAVMPLWAALFAGVFGGWPRRPEWIGLIVGFAGVALLAQEGDFQTTVAGTVLVVIAPMLWAFGSLWSGQLDLPGVWMASAAEFIAGGVALGVLAPLRGESLSGNAGVTAWVALAYLIVMGTVAFIAYVYLLGAVRPTVATSYAYVNPVVAVVLGVTIGAETLTGPVFLALPLILIGVALVGVAQRKPRAAAARSGDGLLVAAEEAAA